jgi:hypothetical protein
VPANCTVHFNTSLEQAGYCKAIADTVAAVRATGVPAGGWR